MGYKLYLTDAFQNYAHNWVKKDKIRLKKQLEKTLSLLRENPRHPGLKTHKISAHPGWCEAYINRSDRIIFKISGQNIYLAWCGNHHDLDKNAFLPAVIEAEALFKTNS